MKLKYLIFCWLILTPAVSLAANPWFTVSAENGYVVAYLKTTSTYMLSTARIFNRPGGTTINCFAATEPIYLETIPAAGYVFDYWTGTLALTGYSTNFIMPEGGATLVAHFKEIVDPEPCPVPEPCPECPECPVCEVPAPCPDIVIPPCPIQEPCPEVIIPPCPEVVVPPCPDCPECPKEKDNEGVCFIGTAFGPE